MYNTVKSDVCIYSTSTIFSYATKIASTNKTVVEYAGTIWIYPVYGSNPQPADGQLHGKRNYQLLRPVQQAHPHRQQIYNKVQLTYFLPSVCLNKLQNL